MNTASLSAPHRGRVSNFCCLPAAGRENISLPFVGDYRTFLNGPGADQVCPNISFVTLSISRHQTVLWYSSTLALPGDQEWSCGRI